MPTDEECMDILAESLQYGDLLYRTVRSKQDMRAPDLMIAVVSLMDLAEDATQMLVRLLNRSMEHPKMSKVGVHKVLDSVDALRRFERVLGECMREVKRLTETMPEIQPLLGILFERVHGEDAPEKAAG